MDLLKGGISMMERLVGVPRGTLKAVGGCIASPGTGGYLFVPTYFRRAAVVPVGARLCI